MGSAHHGLSGLLRTWKETCGYTGREAHHKTEASLTWLPHGTPGKPVLD